MRVLLSNTDTAISGHLSSYSVWAMPMGSKRRNFAATECLPKTDFDGKYPLNSSSFKVIHFAVICRHIVLLALSMKIPKK